jgi:hypothetical protein
LDSLALWITKNKLTSVPYLIPLKFYTAMVKNIYSIYKYVYLLKYAGFMCVKLLALQAGYLPSEPPGKPR